jgi:riboflavin kinase/FMN adenylyltransferase
MSRAGSGANGESTLTFSPGDRIPQGAGLTVGNFDGLHCGHQQIIAELKSRAQARQCPAGLVTFEPSPLVVLHREFPFILTPWAEKQERLARLGLDFILVIPFDDNLRRTVAQVFLEEMLLKPLRPSALVVGPDHRFGSDRVGDAELMSRLAADYGFELRIVPEVLQDGTPVKSTRIRERLLLGDVRPAAALLGYRYCLDGRIIRGRGVGTQLGFPTLNLELLAQEKLVPAAGVYDVNCRAANDHGESPLTGVMNIGFRPTFGGTTQSLEVHLLAPDPGRIPQTAADVSVDFVEHLRPERKFRTPEELKTQIAADASLARLILAENPPA